MAHYSHKGTENTELPLAKFHTSFLAAKEPKEMKPGASAFPASSQRYFLVSGFATKEHKDKQKEAAFNFLCDPLRLKNRPRNLRIKTSQIPLLPPVNGFRRGGSAFLPSQPS